MLASIIVLAQEAEEAHELRVLPAFDELLWGSLAFLLLVAFLLKFAFPRLKTGLEERTKRIQGQLEEAERVKRDADQVLEQYRAQLSDARAEVQRIIDEGKRTAEAMKDDIIAKAEAQAREVVQRAQADVAGERDRAMASLRDTLRDLSIQLAGRVIEKELSSSEAHRALVDRAIEELSGAGNGRSS
ncbi:MAG TPA: F0F1 ATP synthase subunit B [Actinomycetota bacterium]|jgi:F-type H+-transporting ATPase subunit b